MNIVSRSSDLPSMPAMAAIQIHRSGTSAVLEADGEIDLSNQAEFRDAIEAAASDGSRLVIDLTRVTTLSSHAIGVLYRYADRVTAVYVAPNSVIARALNYSGFASRVPVIGDPRPAPVKRDSNAPARP